MSKSWTLYRHFRIFALLLRELNLSHFLDIYVRVDGFDSKSMSRCIGPQIILAVSLVPIGTYLWPWYQKLWFPSFLTEAEIFSAEPQWLVLESLVMKFEGPTHLSLAIECISSFRVCATLIVFGCSSLNIDRTETIYIWIESSDCVDSTYIASDFWYEASFHAKFGVKDLEDARLWGPGGE